MTIGEGIKKHRERIGMSQQELAQRVGFKSRSSVNKIELGERKIKGKEMIEKFAKALGIMPHELLGLNRELDELDYTVLEVYPEWDPETTMKSKYSSEDLLHNFCVSEFPNDYKTVELLVCKLNELNSTGIAEAYKRIDELSYISIYVNNTTGSTLFDSDSGLVQLPPKKPRLEDVLKEHKEIPYAVAEKAKKIKIFKDIISKNDENTETSEETNKGKKPANA